MGNDTNNSKLDQAVKQTLNNYEAPHNAPDWAKMESMLDLAPQSANFRWSNSLNVIIGLAILGGGFLIYSLNSSKKVSTTTEPEVQQPIENTAPSVTTKPITVPAPSVPVVSAPAESLPSSQDNTLSTEPAVIENVKKETVAADNTNKKAEDIVKDKEKKPAKLKQVINTMGNEPVFGDMLDSSRGIVGKTKEKEETKKAAKSQPENTIGWSSFLLKNNLDSLKKYHEQQQKDSLKK